MASAILAGLSPEINNAPVVLLPGTMVLVGNTIAEIDKPTAAGYCVYQPGTRTTSGAPTFDVPTAQLQLVFAVNLSVRHNGSNRQLQDSSHVITDPEFWETNCRTFAKALGHHSTGDSLMLADLIRMERLVLGLGVIATGRYLSNARQGCPMVLQSGGFVCSTDRTIYFQYRLQDKNMPVSYHFHGLVQAEGLAELGWHSWHADDAPKQPTAVDVSLSVAQFTTIAADLGVDKLTHVIDMTSVWPKSM